MLLLVAEAQIDGIGHGGVRRSEGNPVADPDGGRGGGDGLEGVRLGRCPKGEQPAQRITAEDDGKGPVSALKFRNKGKKDVVQRILGAFSGVGVSGDVPVRPGHQVKDPVFQLHGDQHEGDGGKGGNHIGLGLQGGIFVSGRWLNEDARRPVRPE